METDVLDYTGGWNFAIFDISRYISVTVQDSPIIAAHMSGATAGCGGHCPPTFEAKGVQGGTMKMMYSFQFRLYSGVRRGSILFHLLSVLELPGTGRFPPPRLWTPK